MDVDVLLLKDMGKLGRAGDTCRVASGYARNFLIPKGLAIMATDAALKQKDTWRKVEKSRQEQEQKEMEALASRIEGVTLKFSAKAGEKEKLYGSITTGDIAEALGKELGQEIDKRKVFLAEPIKELGTHRVPVRLGGELAPEVTVMVEKEDSSQA